MLCPMLDSLTRMGTSSMPVVRIPGPSIRGWRAHKPRIEKVQWCNEPPNAAAPEAQEALPVAENFLCGQSSHTRVGSYGVGWLTNTDTLPRG
jgi:hypothetical protein